LNITSIVGYVKLRKELVQKLALSKLKEKLLLESCFDIKSEGF